MKVLLILFLFCPAASPEKYKLDINFVVSSGLPNVQEFMATVTMKGVTIIYYDDTIATLKVTHDWMRRLFNVSQVQETYTRELLYSKYSFEGVTQNLNQYLDQTQGHHIIQMIRGCEWDDETDQVDGYTSYGIDGQEVTKFDLKTETWTALSPQAEAIKQEWNKNKARNARIKKFITEDWPERLKLCLRYGRSYLDRKVLPSVSLLQKTPSSPVSCHATGFYPSKGLIYWRKDGEETDEGVDPGHILPNQDESFQMSVDLNVSSIPPEDWMKYDCVFELSGVQNIIITKLDKNVIQSNQAGSHKKVERSHAATVTVLVFFILIIILIRFRFPKN